MAQLRKKIDRSPDNVSKSRALKASILTIIFIFVVILWGAHLIWAIKVMYTKPYGSFLNNLVLGPFTLIANVSVTFKLVSFLNEKILGDDIDADHKKYI